MNWVRKSYIQIKFNQILQHSPDDNQKDKWVDPSVSN